MTVFDRAIDFTLPERLSATVPPERRGLARDAVRLMVAHRWSGEIEHQGFRDLLHILEPGDALVVNVSATIPAALEARSEDGQKVRVHLDSPLPAGLWLLEVRTRVEGGGTSPGPDLESQTLRLPGGAKAHLLARNVRSPRLWVAELEGISAVERYLARHGRPVRYLPGNDWPISEYQTVFALEPGSAEMPSAGRPFTPELVAGLVAGGIAVIPILLHTGVSSFEDDEDPGEERFRVPPGTAKVANALRAAGGRIVAVGTSVARALETVVERDGTLHPGEGLTDLVVTPERGVYAIDGLLTGWHEPRSSHLRLLEAVAGRKLLQRAYDAALEHRYLWHEFGDELLILH